MSDEVKDCGPSAHPIINPSDFNLLDTLKISVLNNLHSLQEMKIIAKNTLFFQDNNFDVRKETFVSNMRFT
jgi:hypothetical protein